MSAYSVPAEIWVEIFEIAVDDWYLSSGDAANSLGAGAPALALSSTNTFLRSVAKAAPRVWATILINVDEPSEFPLTKLKLLNIYLSRSADVPLTISLINANSHQKTEVKKRVLQALNRLLDHSRQWQEAYLYLSKPIIMKSSMPIDNAPLLRKFKIRVHDPPGYALSNHPKYLLEAPNLSELTVHNIVASIDCLPWHTITTITLICASNNIRHFALSTVMDVIYFTPNIVSLTALCTTISDFTISDNHDKIFRASMDYLSLEGFGSAGLKMLDVPNLRTLRFLNPIDTNPEDVQSFVSLASTLEALILPVDFGHDGIFLSTPGYRSSISYLELRFDENSWAFSPILDEFRKHYHTLSDSFPKLVSLTLVLEYPSLGKGPRHVTLRLSPMMGYISSLCQVAQQDSQRGCLKTVRVVCRDEDSLQLFSGEAQSFAGSGILEVIDETNERSHSRRQD